MKKLLAAAAAVGMIAIAAPASAEHRSDRYERSYDRDWGRHGYNINAEQARLWDRLYAGMRNGRLSEREASRYRAGLGEIRRLEARYRRNGLSQWERADLIRRLDRLDTLMTSDIRDRNNYRG
jgi:hypothetical protein